MKRKRILRKALGLGLCLTTMAAALAGCGKSSGGDSLVDQATKNNKDYVFRKQTVDLGGEYDCNSLFMKNDRVYTVSYGDTSECHLFSLNSDGSDLKTLTFPQKDNESYGYFAADGEGNLYSIHSIYDYSDMEDAETYEEEPAGDDQADEGQADADAEVSAEAEAGEAESTENGETAVDTDPEAPAEDGDGAMGTVPTEGDQKYLVKFDPSGKEIYRIDLLKNLGEEEDFYVYSMIYDDSVGLLLSTDTGVSRLDEESRELKKVFDNTDPSSEFYNRTLSLVQGFQGKIYTYYWGDNGIELRTFDPATGKIGPAIEGFSGYVDYSFFGGNGYDLYISAQDGFYGYDMAKNDKTKLLDYTDSDMALSFSVSAAVALSDTEFLAIIPNEEGNYRLTRLTKIPPEEVRDRTVITLAGNYIDYNIRRKVFKFNEENPDYKIKMVDYSSLVTGDDFNAGATQFNLDIVSGNVPDIMFFTTEEPVDSYINKGLFIDLAPFIKNDPDLKDVQFVENLFDAFKTGDKVYQLVPSVHIMSYATKTSLLQGKDHLTIKECQEIIEGKGVDYQYAFGLTTREEMLYQGLLAGGSKFIDWENKKCNYDSDEFMEFLEFVKKFPEKLPDNAYEIYDESFYRDGRSLFSIAYINGFRNYRRYVDGTYGESASLMGYPNELGMNCSVIVPNLRLCISSKSKYTDVCWQFIRQLYMEDYQDKLDYEIPIRQSSFDKLAEKSKERPYWEDEKGVKHYEDESYWLGDKEVKINPLNQEDVDYMKKFVYSLTNTFNANLNVYNIITEEVAPFFAGQKTAKEVAQIIQSRVSIYVNENS